MTKLGLEELIRFPGYQGRTCGSGHDLVKDSPAMWVDDETWVEALYRCMVCGRAFGQPNEKPVDPQPSKYHIE